MDRLAVPRPLAGLLLTLVLAGCGAGRTDPPATAPAPGTAGTAASAAQAMPLPLLAGFEAAVGNRTRDRNGAPGPRYWQQWAEYRLSGELNPVSKRFTGQGTITYHNRSPDALSVVYVHLLHNLFAPSARHNTNVPWAVEGVELDRVAAQGTDLRAASGTGPGYRVDGTILEIRLPRPLEPGAKAELAIDWRIRVPPDGAPRGGQDGEVWFISYWYPQMAVYDDVNGWQIDQYLGNAEFYMGYGDYEVALTVPEGWLVSGTGELVNGDEVLSARTRARLDSAAAAKEVTRVVREEDRGPGKATAAGRDGKLTWRFQARNVRDFAWGASASYLWDAVPAEVGDTNGDARPDSSMIHAFYRPEMRRSHWHETARYGQHSVEFLSAYLWPYPYPHMSIVDGPNSCGGMEYPMMTCIGGSWDTLGMYEVTVHEIGHMWFPMVVGSDEKRHAWMDEGMAQFVQSQAMPDFFKGYDDEAQNREPYIGLAEVGGETELMRHGDRYPSYTTYGTASYYKMATVMVALRGVLGEETFNRGLREYGRRWAFKHPLPQDLFNTFEDVSGQDLSWFWRTWFYETWKLDQAIDTVITGGDSVEVVVSNRGRAPMPVHLVVTRSTGAADTLTVPARVWLDGTKRTTLRVATEPGIRTIEIDPGRAFPDLHRGNQIWPR
ncbi:MAG TPA: M1 family metallopeptidase [Gemmatimonadales bacterium]|nr:M1 family metallopeptidase [Gemmatimonadales bacterium]